MSASDAFRYGPTIARLKDELQAIAGRQLALARPIDYPATPVTRYLTAQGITGGLDVSEAAGVVALRKAIAAATQGRCASRPLLVAGFSQGAEVVVRAVRALGMRTQAHVTVALFGNPSYEPSLPGDLPGSGHVEGLRPAFLHGQYFALPASVRQHRTIDVCAPGDPVCGLAATHSNPATLVLFVLTHLGIHARAYSFGSNGYTERAARFLWTHRS